MRGAAPARAAASAAIDERVGDGGPRLEDPGQTDHRHTGGARLLGEHRRRCWRRGAGHRAPRQRRSRRSSPRSRPSSYEQSTVQSGVAQGGSPYPRIVSSGRAARSASAAAARSAPIAEPAHSADESAGGGLVAEPCRLDPPEGVAKVIGHREDVVEHRGASSAGYPFTLADHRALDPGAGVDPHPGARIDSTTTAPAPTCSPRAGPSRGPRLRGRPGSPARATARGPTTPLGRSLRRGVDEQRRRPVGPTSVSTLPSRMSQVASR